VYVKYKVGIPHQQHSVDTDMLKSVSVGSEVGRGRGREYTDRQKHTHR
jgi:hypothetical protein